MESIYLASWTAGIESGFGSFCGYYDGEIYDNKRTLGGQRQMVLVGDTLLGDGADRSLAGLIQKRKMQILSGKGFQQSVCGQKSVWQYCF